MTFSEFDSIGRLLIQFFKSKSSSLDVTWT